ncbi:hypothetical protein CRG98_017607 [Punica granatum]|uniref:Retrotransposon gag domain-containing protein n=1 Tax=Punica granatum TaxID=22663 RepID=A0A2I0K0D5_PUNGR|nr:hypothetical protein CRG98_017607 [Punica granatum]
MFPKRSILQSRLFLNLPQRMLHRLRLLRACSRHTRVPLPRTSNPRHLREHLLLGPHRRPPPPMIKPASRHSKARSIKWPPTWRSCWPYSRDQTAHPRAPRLRRGKNQRPTRPLRPHRLRHRKTWRCSCRPHYIHPWLTLSPTHFRHLRPPRPSLSHRRRSCPQGSLSGSALDWFMSLKAEDIPTWEDLSRKFIHQYRYCAKTPPTLLELSTKEMGRGQRFEEYAAKWRAQAAKHIPPISEAQQIQLFHSTLRGIYYSHLLAHTSSFSDLIEAGKKLDLGIKPGRMEDPTDKGGESTKKVPATSSSPSGRRGKEVSVNTVNTAHQAPQQYSVNLTTTLTTAPTCTDPNVDSRRGPHCALLDRAAWSESPPSREDAHRTRKSSRARKVVGTDPKGTDPNARKVVGTDPKGTDPNARKVVGTDPKGFAIYTGRIPNELHGSKAPTRWTCEVHERLLGGFAICTGRIPNELHGSKAPTRWTCYVHCNPERVHAN